MLPIIIFYIIIIPILLYIIFRYDFTKKFYRDIERYLEGNSQDNLPIKEKIEKKITSFLDFSGTVYYINLDNRIDRKKVLLQNLENYGFTNIIRFSAVKNDIGAKGCFLSHLKLLTILEKMLFSGDLSDNIMIMEDDGYIKVDSLSFNNQLVNFANKIPDWDVLMLICNKRDDFQGEPVIDNIWRIYRARVCTCYIVNKNYIPRIRGFLDLVDKYSEKYGWKNIFIIDQIFWKLQARDNWYAIYPFIVGVRPNYSDIENKNVNYDACFL
jgi:glycosyl transferase family 25